MELESYLKTKQTHLPNVAVKNDMHFTHNINFLFLFYTDTVILFFFVKYNKMHSTMYVLFGDYPL